MRRLLLQKGNEYETMESLVSGVGNFTSGLCCPHFTGMASLFRHAQLRAVFLDSLGQCCRFWHSSGWLLPDWFILGEEKKG